jgi:hypothetical protein
VNGVLAGVGAFEGAMRSMASRGLAALKSAIGYGSPATAFIEVSKVGIAGGLVEGAKQGAPDVSAALSSLAEPPDVPQRGGARGAGGGSAKGGSPTFVFNGVKDAEQAQSRFEEAYTRMLQGDALMAGAT